MSRKRWQMLLRRVSILLQKTLVKPGVLIAVLSTSVIIFLVFRQFTSTSIDFCYSSERFFSNYNSQLLSVDLPLDAGRSASDGVWVTSSEPFEIYLYSAFYDSRPSLQSAPVLRVIGVVDKSYSSSLYCYIKYPGVKDLLIVSAVEFPIGVGCEIKSVTLQEHVFTCTLPVTATCIPSHVTLRTSNPLDSTIWLPVENPRPPPDTDEQFLGVCVSVSFGELSARMIVEWLELQKLVGVDRVFIYNHSVTGEGVERVLSSYVAEGFLVLRQSHSFLSVESSEGGERCKGNAPALLQMTPVINDCLYRNMHRYSYFAVIDLDEVIIPRGVDIETLPTLIQRLPEIMQLKRKRVGAFVFHNAYFFLDLPPVSKRDDHDVLSVYLSHRQRMTPSPMMDSVKSIVDSQACIAMHNHFCWTYTEAALSDWSTERTVAPHNALLHHYKFCHFNQLLNEDNACSSMLRHAVYDNSLRQYRHSLLLNLENKFKLLQL